MLQRYRRDKEAFGLFKSHRCRVGPNQSFWVAPQEVSERFQNFCTIGEKSAVKVYHAEKTLQLLDILRGGALFDCGGLLRRGGGAFRRNRVAKKFQGGHSKNAFFQIDGEAIGSQSREKIFKVGKVRLSIWRPDSGVVYIDKRTLAVCSCFVHCSLESLCRVGQSERREQKLKEANWRDDCCFWNVLGRDRNLVITFD